MDRLLEFLGYFNWFALPLSLIETLWNAEWHPAIDRHGPMGVPLEAARSLLGVNAYSFFVPIRNEWSGAPLGDLLSRYGVKMWDIGYANGEMSFSVRKSQAAWAQYVMQRAGVPLAHRLYGGEMPQDALSDSTQVAPGQPYASRPEKSLLGSLLDGIDSLFG